MAERTNEYAESTGRSTTTSTSVGGANKVSFVHTPGSSERWWYFWNAILDCSGATSDALARFRNETAGVDYNNVNWEPQDATDNISIFGGKEVTYGASPGSQTIDLDYWAESATAGIADAHVWGTKAETDDKSVAADGAVTRTSSAYATAVTLTETLTGDYLFLCFCEMNSNNASARVDVRADKGGTKYGSSSWSPSDTTTWRSWGTAFKLTGLSGSQTVIIEYASNNNAATVSVRNCRIFALRLGNVANNYSDEDRARATLTGSTTPSVQSSLTFTPAAARNHVAFACAIGDINSNTGSGNYDWRRDATVINAHEEEGNISGDSAPFFGLRRESLAVSSTTYETRKWPETTGLTVGLAESGIYVLDLESTVVGPTTSTGAQQLPRLNQAGVGVMHPRTTGAQTLPKIAQSAVPFERFSATGAQQLPKVRQAGAVVMHPRATGAQLLPSVDQNAVAFELFSAAGAQQLPKVRQAGTAFELFSAIGAQQLPKLRQTGSLTHSTGGHTATGVQQLPKVRQDGVLVMHPRATAAQTLPNVEQAGAIFERFSATGAQQLPKVRQDGVLVMHPRATAAQMLPNVEQAGAVFERFSATGAQQLPKVRQDGVLVMHPRATGASLLPKVRQAGSLSAGDFTAFVGAQMLPSIEQSGNSFERFSATGAQQLPKTRQAGSTVLSIIGAGAQQLPKVRQAGATVLSIFGVGAQRLAAVLQTATGREFFLGTAAQLLPRLRQQSGEAAAVEPLGPEDSFYPYARARASTGGATARDGLAAAVSRIATGVAQARADTDGAAPRPSSKPATPRD
jgi:hypothetical protein